MNLPMGNEGAGNYCQHYVREHDFDRYIAALFAPPERRAHLFALYAFVGELSRIPLLAHEPIAAAIRHQWWSEVVDRKRDGEARANPVATTLLDALEAGAISAADGEDVIGLWRIRDPLDLDVTPERVDGRIESCVLRIAARMLNDRAECDVEIFDTLGKTEALVAAIRAVVSRAAHEPGSQQGQVAALVGAARQNLALAARRRAGLAAGQWPALLHLATVVRQLRFASAHDAVTGGGIDDPHWRRMWTIWRASRDPARIFAE